MEGPKLTQHEIIKFLTLKGGRCTNFELVSNFREALNHPQHQAEARLKFKDIVNRVAIVGEYQNVKYIELKREYSDNNVPTEFPSSQPSSLSSDCGGSYVSPLTQTQNFQPYWRYRLSTSTKVPTLPVRSPDYEAQGKSQNGESASSHLGRSSSESTLSQSVNDIRPPPRTRGRSASAFNRSISANPTEGSRQDPVPVLRKSSFVGEEYLTRRSSVNGYPPMDLNNSLQSPEFASPQKPANQYLSGSADIRRNSEVFTSERQPKTQWPPKPVSEYSLSHSQSFSGSHGSSPPIQSTQYNSSNNLDRLKSDRPFLQRNGAERSPKRTGICSEDILRELEEDATKQYMDSPISRSFNRMHGIRSDCQDIYTQETADKSYSSLPDYSCNYSLSNKSQYQSPDTHRSLANKESSVISHQYLRNGRDSVKEQSQKVNRNIFQNIIQEPTTGTPSLSDNNGSLDDSNSEYDTASQCSSNYEREQFIKSLEKGTSGIQSQSNSGQVSDKMASHEGTPPVPPERRRKHSRTVPEIPEENDSKQVPQQEVLPNSTGKVKDRVQHFDDLEKKRTYSKSGPSPLPDKENRSGKTNLMEDDVSISVLDPKLKREWFVKAAQGDYYALVGLLKKEPKLAAIKDIATTALHWGAKHGDANIVKLIAGTYRVNPNIRSGYTAIHLATLYKHSMIVDLLVHTYGADASIRDYSGKRADQYPENYVRTVAGLKTTERRPLKVRPLEKESSVSAFMRIGSLNLRKSRKSAVFASVRGRNWGSATELRLNNYKSSRKKNSKNIQPEKKCDTDSKNDSDSDSAYGFYSK